MDPSHPLHFARSKRLRFVAQLKDFLRFPSVSAHPGHADDVKRCAIWLANHLRSIGLPRVRMIRTARHPIIYADWKQVPGRPTVLIYGHYDVQPTDPLKEWRSPPFVPAIVGDELYARGASDDKGQLFVHVKALESYLRASGKMPVNVKCLFEGEEEIGSPNLLQFVSRNRQALAADVALISDTRILGTDRPAITYAERGTLSLELEVRGPKRDLHSGNFGGAVHNPLQALCEIIAQLHDRNGRVTIPGFYDRVCQASDRERAYMVRTGPSDAEILRDAQTSAAWGNRGYSLYERITLLPALTINGIAGGYSGLGGKGIIPSSAVAKLSFRLVSRQEPREIERLFREHVGRITPPSVTTSVRTLSMANPVLVNPRHPAMQAAAVAYRNAFGAAPVFLRSGGTIPVVSTFQRVLGLPTILMGFALPDDGMHGPNEKFHLPTFYRGIETSIWFLKLIGESRRLYLSKAPITKFCRTAPLEARIVN